MEKFSNTHLEWNLKILFSDINEALNHHEFFHELLNMVTSQGLNVFESPKL